MIPRAIRILYRAAFYNRKLLSWMDADECNVVLKEDYENIWACLTPTSAETVFSDEWYFSKYVFAPHVPLEYIKIDFEITNDIESSS